MLGIENTEVLYFKLPCILFRSNCNKCRGFQPNVVHL